MNANRFAFMWKSYTNGYKIANFIETFNEKINE